MVTAVFNELLKGVSRSLYLSLRLLPEAVRTPISLAYLFCRAADTLVDAHALPHPQRAAALRMFRKQFEPPCSPSVQGILTLIDGADVVSPLGSEQRLLTHLDDCFQWLGQLKEPYPAFIRHVVLLVTQGMMMDLEVFGPSVGGTRNGGRENPPTPPRALGTLEALDRYCWYIGGAPGEFWTNVGLAGLPRLNRDGEDLIGWGIRFGKGLQLTNILRDLATDLRLGRCYLPAEMLRTVGLSVPDLLDARAWSTVQPVLRELIAIARDHLDHGRRYIQALSRREGRFRLAVAWPLLLALDTLRLVAASPRVLDPTVRLKVSRPRLYGLLLCSLPLSVSNSAFTVQYDVLRRGLSYGPLKEDPSWPRP